MQIREKRTTAKRKAETPLERVKAQHLQPLPHSESEQSDIEIEISDDSPDPTQVSCEAREQSIGMRASFAFASMDHHVIT